MEQIKGGITAVQGFEAAAAEAQIKYEGRTDMALIYSSAPCVAAGTFTTNVVKAAPVKWDQKIVAEGNPVHAVIVNSGIANACTGAEGMQYCEETAQTAAEIFGIQKEEVLVGSTGVIGKQLPMEKIKAGIQMLAAAKGSGEACGSAAAQAILTTDTQKKEAAVQVEIGGKTVTIGAMAKGSGMIHPNMCTMLSFLVTDAVIAKETLQKVLREDVEETYNMISVDGDTSTNDTVLFLANGLAKNSPICPETEEYEAFAAAVHFVNEQLAKAIAGDGEGATALLEVQVVGASDREQAKKISKSIVCSNLTKTAVAGHDANWGRILCAMGYAGVSFDPEQIDLFLESEKGTIQILSDGAALPYSEAQATEILSEPAVKILADLKMGDAEATAWGCDLTHGYIEINADYRS
nr:bifunctional glutamate N-acetyltransferase/amino-acid acetyltransferase ArgJ [uncultured Faecalimonas sp.]